MTISGARENAYPDLDYTMRLGATFGQRSSEFLFFPIQFSGPQVYYRW